MAICHMGPCIASHHNLRQQVNYRSPVTPSIHTLQHPNKKAHHAAQGCEMHSTHHLHSTIHTDLLHLCRLGHITCHPARTPYPPPPPAPPLPTSPELFLPNPRGFAYISPALPGPDLNCLPQPSLPCQALPSPARSRLVKPRPSPPKLPALRSPCSPPSPRHSYLHLPISELHRCHF